MYDLIALTRLLIGSSPNADLLSDPLVSIVPLSAPPRFLQTTNKLLFPPLAFLKVVHQTWSLWNALLYRCEPAQWMLVQVSQLILGAAWSSLES